VKNLIFILLLISCESTKQHYVPNFVDVSGNALEMLTNVNLLRTSNGLNKLKAESELMELAQAKAEDMYLNNYIDHRGFHNREILSGCTELGECLAYNYNSVESSFNAWESSKMHYLTLIKVNTTGFGFGEKGKYKCLLIARYEKINNN